MKCLDLYGITVDEHLHSHVLHTILDAFEDLHKQQLLLKNMATMSCMPIRRVLGWQAVEDTIHAPHAANHRAAVEWQADD